MTEISSGSQTLLRREFLSLIKIMKGITWPNTLWLLHVSGSTLHNSLSQLCPTRTVSVGTWKDLPALWPPTCARSTGGHAPPPHHRDHQVSRNQKPRISRQPCGFSTLSGVWGVNPRPISSWHQTHPSIHRGTSTSRWWCCRLYRLTTTPRQDDALIFSYHFSLSIFLMGCYTCQISGISTP